MSAVRAGTRLSDKSFTVARPRVSIVEPVASFVVPNGYSELKQHRLSSSEVRFYTVNYRFAFLIPFGGLRKTYTTFILGSLESA